MPLAILHEVITFYSYKGGTGRTMALANVACLLGRELGDGQRVLAIDWDLEAPGLHYFFDSLNHGRCGAQPGVVELFTKLNSSLPDLNVDGQDDSAADQFIDSTIVTNFIYKSRVTNVDVMPAGVLDESYQPRLAKIDWEGMYARCPAIYRAFARRLSRDYAVVLVDSRTGLTDISGICTALLPDKLIVVFTPNRQSLAGVESLIERATQYRRASKDLRSLLVYPVPSRIDNQLEKLRSLWRYGDSTEGVIGFQPQFEAIFRDIYALPDCDMSAYFEEVQIQYSPEHAYGESIAVLDPASKDRFSISRSYQALVDWLCASATPWERPDQALARRHLEWLLAQEESGAWHGPQERRHRLERLEEMVALSRSVRGERHPETITALRRLRDASINEVEERPQLIASLEELVGGLAQAHGPQRWAAIEYLLESAGILRGFGELEAAEHLLRSILKVVDHNHDAFGAREMPIAIAAAHRLYSAGRLQEARELFQRIANAQLRMHGEEHPDTLTSRNTLANISADLGDLAGARALQVRVLDARCRVLGEEHPDTLTTKNRLAETLFALGEIDTSRALQERVLEARRRVLGEEHPDTLTTMSWLAEMLFALGEINASRALQQQVLEARRRVLGEEHPDTLTSLSNVTNMSADTGDLIEARALHERVLAARRRVLGEEHPDTLTSMNNLASTLADIGDLAGARALQERTLEARRRVLGQEHPDTLTSLSNLGTTLADIGDLSGARALQERTLDARQRVLGREHPDTLKSTNNLASTLAELGDLPGARALQEQVSAAYIGRFGNEHPNTLASLSNLAITLAEMGDLTGARALQERVLAARSSALGSEHPATLRSMNNLAFTLARQDNLAGAQELQKQVLAGYRRLLGDEHPDTLSAMNNLASTLASMGDRLGARTLQEQVLEARHRVLGEEHPDTLTTMNQLAETLLVLGDIDASRKMQAEILAVQRRSLDLNTRPRSERPL